MKKDELVKAIKAAFANVPHPGDDNLRNSNEGVEPFLLEAEFKGKDDWTNLSYSFIDQAPDGFGSALSFFSKDAFRFYLPAYLLADLQEALIYTDVVFHLTHGLTDSTKEVPVNPIRYGSFTWFEYVSDRFSTFTPEQSHVIRLYLKHNLNQPNRTFDHKNIRQALDNFWISSSRGSS